MQPGFRFGTVGSPKSTPARPGGTPGAVAQTNALGLSALEIAWVQSVRVSEATCARINALGQQHDVALSVHAPYYINLYARDDAWPRSRQRLLDAAHYGALAGATDIIFHPGSYFKHAPDVVLPVAIERLAEVSQHLCDQHIHVTLRPETMGKASLLGSFEDTLAMSKAVPGVQPCIDIAHLHARNGDGAVNTYAEFAGLLDQLDRALGGEALRRMHIHISGIAWGPKGEQHHLTLAESDFNYHGFLLALHDAGAGGRMLCESPIMEDDALHLKSIWAELSG